MADEKSSQPVDIDALADYLETSFLTSNAEVSEATDVMKKYVPDWPDVRDAFDRERREHWDRLAKVLGKDIWAAAEDEADEFPEDINEAIAALFIRRGMIEIADTIRDYLGGLDLLTAFDKVWSGFKASVDAKRGGGKARAKFTPEVRGVATPIFQALKRSKISNDAAYRRTAAKLLADFGIDISPKTISRHLSSDNSDNA